MKQVRTSALTLCVFITAICLAEEIKLEPEMPNNIKQQLNCIAFTHSIDLTQNVTEPKATNLGQGTNFNPAGDTITADNRSFFFNEKPWMPVAGEFHFSRYPENEWYDELSKIKAGGIEIVSTYVFWIHHQEQPGEFDFAENKSLRYFVKSMRRTGFESYRSHGAMVSWRSA